MGVFSILSFETSDVTTFDCRWARSQMLVVLLLLSGMVLGQDDIPPAPTLIISEFMAANRTTLQDEDGDTPDWVEVYHAGAETISLDGWYLTDDIEELDKWPFPPLSLNPGESLLVFASGKDRAVVGHPLHTNFKLNRNGEYLGLTRAHGSIIVDAFTPSYPSQEQDVSYGIGFRLEATSFVSPGSLCRIRIPEDATETAQWFTPSHDDETWKQGTLGVGYELGNGYEGLYQTDLFESMFGVNASVYLRIPFNISHPTAFSNLNLHIQSDDGFVAYLNGSEVARDLAPDPITWNSTATHSNEESRVLAGVDYDLSSQLSLLQPGENLLAIQGLNQNTVSPDFLLAPRLEAITTSQPIEQRGFLSEPSPGQKNIGGLRHTVVFSVPSGVYDADFEVSLSALGQNADTIRYTLDGSIPSHNNGSVYQEPIPIQGNLGIRAAVTIGDEVGVVSEAHYFRSDPSMQDFSSNLPLLLVHSFGKEPTSTRNFLPVALTVLEPDRDGRTRMTSFVDYEGCGDLHLRGNNSASGGTPKKQLKLSLCTADNQNRNASLLGMSTDEDWVLINPGKHDRSRLNNPIMFELGRACGEPWVSRYRFVELFINTQAGDTAQLSYARDYRGLYIVAERIKVHPERVNITELTPEDNQEPAISGGYILKMDERCDSDEVCFTSPMIQATQAGAPKTNRRLVFDTPDQEKLTPEQFNWMADYIDRFENALASPLFHDPNVGYQAYIDRDSWIRQHILQMVINNIEAMRKSIYYYKDRGELLKAGPLWDFDWALNKYSSTEWPRAYRDNWWGYLFRAPDFQITWEDRWFSLREGPLSHETLDDLIDRLGGQIREAWDRDAARWPSYAQNYDHEMARLHTWFQERLDWIDRQYISPPTMQTTALPDGSFQRTLSHPQNYQIYYTLDGRDPRAPGGGIQPFALHYEEPLSPPEYPVLVQARALSETGRMPTLQALRRAVIGTDVLPLELTEFHHNDPRGNNHEYLVLYNRSTVSVPLTGYTLEGDIDFNFEQSSIQSLNPGASLALADDAETYRDKKTLDPSLPPLAGTYQGNLNNKQGQVELSFYGEILLQHRFP